MLSKSLRWWAVALLSLSASGASAWGANPKGDASHFTGRVEAAEQAGISARVAGVVDKVNVDIGDRVKKGQVLIELSAPELKDDLDLATARAAQARAEIEEAEAAAQAAKARLFQADAGLEAARVAVKPVEAAVNQAQAQADRLRKLGDANAVSRQEIEAHLHKADAARAAVEEAEAGVKTAEAARDVAAAELAKAQAGVKATQAGVAIAQAGVHRAETQLAYTKIVAPFDGLIARRTVDVGAVVGPPKPGDTAPLVTVMRDDVVHVVFDLTERSAQRVAVGASAVVHVPSLGDATFSGKVTRKGGAFNPLTGTVRAEVDLPNADGKLRPGMYVSVDVTEDHPGK